MDDLPELSECIKALREKVEKYSKSALNEAQTRLILIDTMLKCLGWDVTNPDQVEVEHKTVDGKAVDYALKIEGRAILLVEAKPLSDPLTDVKAITQVVGYASNEGVDWCVLTNGSTYRIYRSTVKAPAPDKLLYEVCIGTGAAGGIPVEEIAREMERLSRKAVESGALDQFAERVFFRSKVLKALEKLFSDPPPKFIEIVMGAAGDGSIKSSQAIEGMKDFWTEWQQTSSSNRLRFSSRVSLTGDLKDTGNGATPSHPTENEDVKKPSTNSKPPVIVSSDVFPASVPRAFLEYGALSVKAPYRTFLPPNQEGQPPQERTYFTVRFPGYVEVPAYMSQGRLKIKDKNVWREIVSKLDVRPDDTFMVKIIEPSKIYEANKQ